MNKPLRSIGGVVAQGSRVASPELIEAMKVRARQLWLRLVIGVLI